MNKVIQVGRIVRDAETKEVRTGGGDRLLVKFAIAVKKSGKPKEGEKDAYFRNVVTFVPADSKLPNYLKKGAAVAVDGEWTTSEHAGKYYEEINTTGGRIEIVQFAESSAPAAVTIPAEAPEDDLPF